MRMASTTISDAKMKTCEEASPVAPSADQREAGPGDAVDRLGEHQAAAPDFDVDLAARRRDEAAAQLEQHDFGGDDQSQPQRSPRVMVAQNIEASEKITASSGMVATAPSSLRTNISISSCSNSGLMSCPATGAREPRGP